MSIIKRLWWFFKLEKKRYIIGVLSLSLVSVLNLIPPKVMGTVIDHISSQDLTNSELAINLVWLLLSAVAMYILRYIWRVYIVGTSYRLGKILRSQLFDHFTKMSPSFFQRYRTGDLMAHATNDINSLTALVGWGVMSAVDASITAMVTLLTMFFVISWQMTLIAIIPMPFMAIATGFLARKTHETFKETQAAFSELNNKVQENVSGVKVTKSFGYQNDEIKSFQKVNENAYKKNMHSMFYDSLFDPMILLFVGASYTLTLLIGGYLVSQNSVTLGDLVTFITYLDMLVWPLMAIGYLFNIIQRGDVSYGRITDLLAVEADITDSENALAAIENGAIEYDIHSFAYDKTEVLHDIKFTLEKGQTLGIVGQTGSGKTSLIRLLLRQFDIEDGSISINGHNIKDYRLSALRSLMGYVPQDQMLFAMSIEDNIRFSNPDLSDEAVISAAKLSNVYDDIMAMPEQFKTIIGEKGVSLSGGQRQRIAMSRAMVMKPEILILDDSLSAVDAKTEHNIIENLKSNRQAKTTIITAHRLSAVVHADLIIVMKDGEIIERGTHEQLVENAGWYAKTYESQQLEWEEDDVE